MSELAGRTATRRAGQKPASGSSASSGAPSGVMELQRTVGNQATATLLGDGSIQRRGRKRRGKRGRHRKRNQRGTPTQATPTPTPAADPSADEEQEQSQGWGSWLSGLATSALGVIDFGAADDGDTLLEGEELETTSGEFTDEHDESLDKQTLFGPPEISITLVEGELKQEIAGAEIEGAYDLKQLLDGYEGSAKVEISHGHETTTTATTYDLLDGTIVSEFDATTFVGSKVGAKAKGALTADSVALRAEASAFAGYEETASAKVKLNVGNQQVATFKGAAGYTVGFGGEAKGHISFDGGRISMGSKGAISYGLGATWEYKLEIDSPAVAKGLWNVLSRWGSWLSGVAATLHEAMTDEDGHPIMIL